MSNTPTCAYNYCEPEQTGCLLGDRTNCRHEIEGKSNARELEKARIQELITHAPPSPLYQPIKMLCWKQPFASLMLPPYCKVETRSQRIAYRGLVLIVATAKPYNDQELVTLCGGEKALRIATMVAGHDGYINGCAIGIGRLAACNELMDFDFTYIRRELHEHRFAWRFLDVYPIEPIPMKGFQGWRNASEEIRSQIKLL